MPQSRLSLARVDLPPDLSQSIISMVRDNEAASAATLVGNVSTSTPLTKFQSVSETLKGRNRVKHTPSLVQLRSPDGKIELFYDREKNEFFSAAWEETPGNHHYEGDEEGNSLLNEASILAHSVFDGDGMDTDEESNDAMASNLSEGTEELNGDNDIRMGDNDTTNPGSPSPVPGPQERREDHYVTLKDIRSLVSLIREGQQKTADQIATALGSYRDRPAADSGDEGPEPRPSKPRPQERQAPTKDRSVKFRSPHENELSRKIREYLAYDLTPNGEWLENVVSPEEVERFDPELEECCAVGDFRLHLEGTAGDVWNKSATRVLVNSFLEVHGEYDGQNWAVREMVINKCAAVVKSTIRKYREKNKRVSLESRELARRRKNRAERKRALFHRRRDLTFFYPILEPERKKLDLLGISGMSSDEEEKVAGRWQWRILAPRWRSARVTGWLRYFDALYERGRRVSGNDRGPFPRHRGSARTTSNNKRFVRGLPRNAYRTDWLEGLVDVENIVRPTSKISWAHDETVIDLALNDWDTGGDDMDPAEEEAR